MPSIIRVDDFQTSNGVPILSTSATETILKQNVKIDTGKTFTVPTWTSTTRPSSPVPGMIGYNSTSEVSALEIYAGSGETAGWVTVGASTASLPSNLTPYLWYKGETIAGLTDGSNVTSFSNSGSAGSTFNLETGSNGTPPQKTTINGYPSLYWPTQSARHLRFVGSQSINLISGGSFGNNGFTCFWVSRTLAEYGSQYGAGGAFVPFCGYPGGGTHSSFGHIYTAGSNSADQRWGILWENDGFVPYSGASGNRSPNPLESGGGAYPVYESIPSSDNFGTASATQYAFRHMGNSDPVPSLTSAWRNKSGNPFFQTKYSSLYPSGYTGTSNVTIRGIGGARSNQWLGGWILEILLYNSALSDANVTTVRNYLGAKYKNHGSTNS